MERKAKKWLKKEN